MNDRLFDHIPSELVASQTVRSGTVSELLLRDLLSEELEQLADALMPARFIIVHQDDQNMLVPFEWGEGGKIHRC